MRKARLWWVAVIMVRWWWVIALLTAATSLLGMYRWHWGFVRTEEFITGGALISMGMYKLRKSAVG